MALYTKSSQSKSQSTTHKSNTLGIVLVVVSLVCLLCLTFDTPRFFSKFLIGTFGLIVYAIVAFLFAMGTADLKDKKLFKSIKYFIFVLIAAFGIVCMMHLILSHNAVTSLSFSKYINECYNSKTVGGVIIGIITYGLSHLLNIAGAYVIFGIITVLFTGLCVDFIITNKNVIDFSNGGITEKIIESHINNKRKAAEQLNISNKNQEVINKNISGTDSILKDLRLKSDNKIVNKRAYILTPPSAEELFNLKPKTDYSANNVVKSENVNTSFLPNRPKRNPFKSPESIQRSRDFLRSTYPSLIKEEKETTESFDEDVTTECYNEDNEISTNTYDNSFDDKINAEEDIVSIKLDELKDSLDDNNYNSPISAANSAYSSSRASLLNDPKSNINNQSNETFNLNNPSRLDLINNNTNISKVASNQNIYIKPPLDLLNTISSSYSVLDEDCQKNSVLLEQTLEDFRIPAKVKNVIKGPAVTRYEIQMPPGISVKKIQQHSDDIAMALSANGKIRIEAPIPGKNAVGIEVPNEHIATIGLKDVLESKTFQSATSPLTFALGKDIYGASKVGDIKKLTHILVAGTTGSGKSVCLNSMIISLMYKSSPEDLKFILIDPKRVEFAIFNGMPHLLLPEIISEPEKAINALGWCIEEMERRYELIQELRVKNIQQYNNSEEVLSGDREKLPYIVVIVDELSDLIMSNRREVEDRVLKLAQKSRAAGIHLVLATQRPSVDVITGTIKGNLPSRIAFTVASFPDSKTILDCGGAEKLLGRGDMLYDPQELQEPIRIQGAFLSNSEVQAVVDFIKDNNPSAYDAKIENKIYSKPGASSDYVTENEFDEYFTDALRLVIETGTASISLIQRKFAVGYNRAGRIVDQMERERFVGPQNGSKPRPVYLTMEEFKKRYE